MSTAKTIRIMHCVDGSVLWEGPAATIKDAIHAAIAACVDLRSADLRSSDLQHADLRSADMRSANLQCVDLQYADLRHADLRSANLQYADLQHAHLRHADLQGVDLQYADLRSADLQYVDLQYANLQCVDLQYADLRHADLRSANLQYADLQHAHLRHADLRYVDLRYADVRYVDLRYADVRRVDLRSADVRFADIRCAKGLDAALITPLLMLLDQPGPIRAYKLVTDAGFGPFTGGVKYDIGATVSVDDANTDPLEQCASGINVATLDWCLANYSPGNRVLIVEFTAQDIACIPTATDGKFRLHRCRVVAEKDISALVAPATEVVA